MKPYGKTNKDYGDTGCCPGHDNPVIRKWSGTYGRANTKIYKRQNRTARRLAKQGLDKQGRI